MKRPIEETPPAPRFNVRHIRAFLILVEELHFGRAAERLFISQPALSRMIRTLEGSIGVALFGRSTRRVQLTAAGEAFAGECRLAYEHILRSGPAARDAAAGYRGSLHVSYMNLAINGCLPELIRAYRDAFPNVNIELEYSPSSKQYYALLEGRIDIGFVIGSFQSQKVHNLLVDEDEYVALLPSRHPLIAKSSLSLPDLATEPFVIGNENAFDTFRRFLFPLCHNAGFFPNIVQQASNADGIMGMVAAGVGVSIYAGCTRNALRKGVEVRTLNDVAERIPVYAIWSSENPSTTLRGFTDFLMQHTNKKEEK